MTEGFTRPAIEALREALRACEPGLANAPLAYLTDGWDFWTYRLGDEAVLRVAKQARHLEKLDMERRLLPELSPYLPLPISVPLFYCEQGPNGLPMCGQSFVRGVPVIELERPVGGHFGRDLGRFVKALQAFPVERASELGVKVLDGPGACREPIELYESVVRRAFPLLSCETRTYAEGRFEAYLNEPRNFNFEPRLVHHDLDRRNVIVDPETGEMAGVVDFGDAVFGNPAIDLWMPLMDFESLGIGHQTGSFLEAFGSESLDLARAKVEVEFLDFLWPFHEILYGLSIEDDEFVENALRWLNEMVSRDLKYE